MNRETKILVIGGNGYIGSRVVQHLLSMGRHVTAVDNFLRPDANKTASYPIIDSAYQDLDLTLQSGIYGSTFFMLTGFHGAHVILGSLMLIIMLIRINKGHFTADNHFGFEAAAWYWHFVDVVWLGLFVFVYIL